jgi:hypothetical protein
VSNIVVGTAHTLFITSDGLMYGAGTNQVCFLLFLF